MKVILVLLTTLVFLSAQQKGGFSTKGSFYTDLSLLHYHNRNDTDSLGFAGMSTLSLNVRNRNRRFAKLDGALELKMPYGSFTNSVEIADDSSDTAPLSDYVLFSMDGSVLLLDVRRLYSSFYFDRFTLSLGRQNIDFGKGTLFSPADQFSKVEVSDFRYRKRGSDVIHVDVPFSDLWGVTGTVELPYGEREHSSALKFYGTAGTFDLALMGIYRHREEAFLPGFSFKGDAFVGLYGEGVVNIPTSDTLSVWFDGMMGIDYSIRSKWFFIGEYQFLGEKREHSLFGSVNYAVNELISTGASVIHTLSDGSSIATAQFTWNALQNADLTLFVRGYNNDPLGENLPVHDVDYSLRATVKF